MEDFKNPYAPPKSETGFVPAKAGVQKVYSPTQGWAGTFLGGPLVGTYLLRANFAAIGKSKHARQATLWGVVLSAVILLSLPFLPERTPGYILPIAYSMTVRLIIERAQFTKNQIASSDKLAFHSNWRVLGVGLLGLVVFLILGVAEFLLLPTLGLN